MSDKISKVAHTLAISAINGKIQQLGKWEHILDLAGDYQRAALDKECMKGRYSDILLLHSIQSNSLLKPFIHEQFEDLRVMILGSKWLPGIAANLKILIKNNYLRILNKKISSLQIQLEVLLLRTFYEGISLEEILEKVTVSKRLNAFFQSIEGKLAENLSEQIKFHELVTMILSHYKSCHKPLTYSVKSVMEFTQSSQKVNKSITSLDPIFSEATELLRLAEKPFEMSNYKIYTDQFDEIVKAIDLSSNAELVSLKKQLKDRAGFIEPIPSSLITKLKNRLMAKTSFIPQINEEFGYISPKSLINLVINPTADILYIKSDERRDLNTAISFLIDNSGSMKGLPIIHAASIVKLLVGIFKDFRIKTEILGYTTVEWQGGRSKKLWEKEGMKPNPGRIGDLRHIVYKAWNETQTIENIAIMLKSNLLKENIDGEALLWAASRLDTINARRKILIVISDGAPVEDTTLKYNVSNLLDKHLKLVTNTIETKYDIELIAFGIHHEVSQYYSNSFTIPNLQDIAKTMISKFTSTLG